MVTTVLLTVEPATAAGFASGDVPAAPARGTWRPSGLVITSGLLLAVSAGLSARAADADSGRDLALLLGRVAADSVHLRWQYALAVLLLAGLHYVATAVAAQAAAGRSLRFGETLLVQLAAAAANRLTPAGLGGAAVTARYFNRRGLPAAGAFGAVATMSVLGAFADLLVLTVLVLAGSWLGLGGAQAEVSLLTSKLTGLLAPVHSTWPWVIAASAAVVLLVCRHYLWSKFRSALSGFCAPIRVLAGDRRALARLLAASSLTTLILAVAFVASTAMVPGRHPHAAIGALLMGFMLGSAAGGAVPTPAGIGATETALVAVLMISGLPAARAVEIVVVFRLMTFWAPAVIGLLATRRLRQTGAL